MHIETTFKWQDKEYTVTAEVNFHPGVRTFANGDPGYPDDGECLLQSITDENGDDVLTDNTPDALLNAADEAAWERYHYDRDDGSYEQEPEDE